MDNSLKNESLRLRKLKLALEQFGQQIESGDLVIPLDRKRLASSLIACTDLIDLIDMCQESIEAHLDDLQNEEA